MPFSTLSAVFTIFFCGTYKKWLSTSSPAHLHATDVHSQTYLMPPKLQLCLVHFANELQKRH